MAIKKLKATQVPDLLKQLIKHQGGVCAVCGQPFNQRDRAVLDHDHETGIIRGALHNSCNGAEGKIKVKAYRGHKGVSPTDLVIGLGEYLAHHKTPRVNLLHPTHLTDEDKRLKRNAAARLARAKAKVK